MNPGAIGFAAPDDEATQVRRIKDIERALQEMFADGTLRALIDSLPVTVAATLAAGITTTTVNASGRVTATGGVTSADVKSRVLSVAYDAVYIDTNNIMGKSPSALRFKQDLEEFTFDPELVDKLQGYTFRLRGAVEVLGDDAPREHGYIADYVHRDGMEMFARFSADGEFSGLAYERMIVLAIDALKDARSQLRELKAENTAIRSEIQEIKDHLSL